MTEQQATFVESYLADHVHDMDSMEEVQAQAEEAMRLFKEIAENPHMICKECGFFMGESYVYCGASADGVCPECGTDDGKGITMMKKYTVELLVTEERTANVEIEAENEESARSQAEKLIPYDDYEVSLYGDITGEVVGSYETK